VCVCVYVHTHTYQVQIVECRHVARKAFWPLIEEDFGFMAESNASASTTTSGQPDQLPPSSCCNQQSTTPPASTPARTKHARSAPSTPTLLPAPSPFSSPSPSTPSQSPLSIHVFASHQEAQARLLERKKQLVDRISTTMMDEGAFGSFWCINANNLHQRNLEVAIAWQAEQPAHSSTV
jgi:hypothetical protein